ncbi:MAG: hypothetical protein ABI690_21775 [Chloroflexota bacterium]
MKRLIWLLALTLLLPFASLNAQDTTSTTFNYQGKDYPIYLVPTDDGTVHQWALVKKGRKSSQFIDPTNPDAGLIEWVGSWRTLSAYFPPSEMQAIPTATADQNIPIDVKGPNLQLFGNMPLEKAVLAPDGSAVAGIEPTSLCIYTFNNDTKNCFPYPDGLGGSPRTIYWSPDSKTIAFTEDLQVFLQESDVWTLDTVTGSYSDLTDDHITGNLSATPPLPQSPLDYIPTWNPTNDDLYFVRSEIPDDHSQMSAKLNKLSLKTGDLTEVLDLSPILSTSSLCLITDTAMIGPGLHGVMTISPDGTTMAILVRNICSPGQEDPNNGVWLVDLAAQTPPHLLISQSQLQSGMPTYRQDIALIPSAIAWVAGGSGLLVTSSNVQYAVLPPANIAYYVDVATGSSAPVLDFSKARKDELDFTQGTAHDVPYGFGVSADGKKLIMISSIPSLSILSLDLPPDGSMPVRIYLNQDAPKGIDMRFSTAGTDGKMLIAGFLVTFDG